MLISMVLEDYLIHSYSVPVQSFMIHCLSTVNFFDKSNKLTMLYFDVIINRKDIR